MSSINFEFQRSIPFTEFIENDSWLQKRDPGAYLFGFILFFAGVLITQSWIVITAGFLFCLIGIWLSKIQISLYLKGLVKALPFILIIAAINLFINPAKDISGVIFQFWIFKVSIQDVTQSLLLVTRFIIFMLAISLTTANYSISRFIHGMEDVLLPLTWIKIPIQDFIVSVEIAIRYIPLLTLTAERIAKAQASRGATWGTSKGKIQDKIRQVFPLIVPLFLQSFQKADKIALAMDARGYGLIKKRSRYHTSRVTSGDIVFVLVQIIFIAYSIFAFTRI
jgi:energy-coupling factor transport system permease protein